MRCLLVNADDFNLTEGVSRGILLAHKRGIVTSTSIFVNLPLSSFQKRIIETQKTLGIGLHLNATFGKPISKLSSVRSLTDSSGNFKRFHPVIASGAKFATKPSEIRPDESRRTSGGQSREHRLLRQPSGLLAMTFFRELAKEFDIQLHAFCAAFGRRPDHLNTHHHIHALPGIFEIVAKLGAKHGISVRRVQAFVSHYRHSRDSNVFLLSPKSLIGDPCTRFPTKTFGNDKLNRSGMTVTSSDYFFGNLSAKQYWTEESLKTVIQNLPEGISEIMCHPGFVDSELGKQSSFTAGRGRELALFSSSSFKTFLKKEGVQLISRVI